MPRKPNPRLSYAADQVRRYDYDRYLTSLFAPADRREGLFALLAFNIEVAKTRETVTEPLLGQIRLQWWREAIAEIYDGDQETGDAVRRHEVAIPLADAIRTHNLPRRAFDQLIDAREFDLTDQAPESLGTLMDYLDATAGGLFHLAAILLGARDTPSVSVARSVGRAWGLTGLIRAIPFHARQQRCFIPQDLLEATGLKQSDLYALKPVEPLEAAVQRLWQEAKRRLQRARNQRDTADAAALPALLPAVLAGRYLKRMEAARFNILSEPPEIGRLRRQIMLWRAARRGRF